MLWRQLTVLLFPPMVLLSSFPGLIELSGYVTCNKIHLLVLTWQSLQNFPKLSYILCNSLILRMLAIRRKITVETWLTCGRLTLIFGMNEDNAFQFALCRNSRHTSGLARVSEGIEDNKKHSWHLHLSFLLMSPAKSQDIPARYNDLSVWVLINVLSIETTEQL